MPHRFQMRPLLNGGTLGGRNLVPGSNMLRRFAYVGPTEIRDRALQAPAGVSILSREGLFSWLRDVGVDVAGENGWATYVVALDGSLVVAPRRSEHVACAQGAAVLAAGEVQFSARGDVLEVTNNSTGYCPSEDCWESVRSALDRASLEHPPEFTFLARFRLCPTCGERNLVKDDWYQCALCDAELPLAWNFERTS
jgi:hypothetical protein